MQKTLLSSGLKKSTAILVATALLSAVCLAEALPELDCLVEPNAVVDVGSPEHGVVESVAVDRSDTVSPNDILAKLESSEQAAAVRKARARTKMHAELEAREATLAFAERKQKRMRDLYASDAISSHQRDEVETELKMAQMQLQQARDALSLARIDLDRAKGDLNRRTIRSPIAGIIVERFVAPGEYVNEKPLMRVAQMNPLRVETIAPAALFGKIKPGMRARVTAEAYIDQVLLAEVTIVDRLIDAASGTFGIRLELPNPDYAIPSGLNCRLSILPQQRVAAVTEPKPVVDTSIGPETDDVKPGTTPAPTTEQPAKTAAMPAATVSAKPKTHPAPTAVLKAAIPTETGQPNDPVTRPGLQTSVACTTFGPFDDDNQLDALLATLGADAREIGRRAEQDEQNKGFFVATRQMATMAAADTLGESIKKRGIKDLAVLRVGPNGGRVSLGLFHKLEYAKIRQQNLATLGIDTEVIPRRLNTRQLWLDVELPATTLEWAPWKKLAPDIKTADCEPSLYVMADTVRPPKSAK